MRVSDTFFGPMMVVILAGALLAATAAPVTRAQEPARTVDDGVFSDAQATRGAAAFDGACSGCHRADLTGNSGPALRGQRFASQYAGKDLRTLFTKIATTMPKNAAVGSLPENVNLEIVAHLLRENGFPAGSVELAANALEGIRVLPGRPKPPPPVGDFSYVEVVGCLTAGPQHTWTLTRASDPVSVVPGSALRQASEPSTATASTGALGTRTVHLVDAMAYAPDAHAGHTIYLRGLLITLAGEPRMTISAFEMVSPTCR